MAAFMVTLHGTQRFGALPKSLLALSPWTGLVLVWALGSAALWLGQVLGGVGAPFVVWLDWQPGLWIGQPWRLWTAALVHWSGAHLLLNLLACAVLVAWGNAARLGTRDAVAWLLAWPLTHGLLALWPTTGQWGHWGHFGGLSGVLHAGVAIGAWAVLRRGSGQVRWVGALVLAALGAKLLLEAPWAAPWLGMAVLPVPLAGAPGFEVAGIAHLTGAVSGLVCAMALDLGLGRTTTALQPSATRVQGG
jgi:hypothetical protein